jgi:hypothetical protein
MGSRSDKRQANVISTHSLHFIPQLVDSVARMMFSQGLPVLWNYSQCPAYSMPYADSLRIQSILSPRRKLFRKLLLWSIQDMSAMTALR